MECEDACPLCMEDLDVTDKNFRPCKCGYQICLFCYRHIKEDLNGLCPACRTPYDEANATFVTPDPQECAPPPPPPPPPPSPAAAAAAAPAAALPRRRARDRAPATAQDGADGQGEDGEGDQGQEGAGGPGEARRDQDTP